MKKKWVLLSVAGGSVVILCGLLFKIFPLNKHRNISDSPRPVDLSQQNPALSIHGVNINPLYFSNRRPTSDAPATHTPQRKFLSDLETEIGKNGVMDSSSIKFIENNIISSSILENKSQKLVPGVTVLPEKLYTPDLGEVLTTGNGYVYFKSEQANLKNFHSERGGLAVYSPFRNQIGMIDGTISIVYSNIEEANQVAQDYGLNKIKTFPEIQVMFLKSTDGQNLEKIFAYLKNDSRVKNAKFEITPSRRMRH